jgi:hypothetical protein
MGVTSIGIEEEETGTKIQNPVEDVGAVTETERPGDV